jgi:hypothetical protein
MLNIRTDMVKYTYHMWYFMGCKPDQWAKNWIEKKRLEDPETVKGWTIEKRSDSHYVKWGTTYWDKGSKKYRKVSKHIGTLNPNGTITYAEPMTTSVPRDVKDHGNAFVLEKASERIVDPLRTAFPDNWKELLALAYLRLLDCPRLNHAADAWRLIDDTRGLSPRMSPERLSDALNAAGGAFGSREEFFSSIDGGERHLIVDMSVVFSRSKGALMLRKGYNRYRFQGTQFNLAAVCGAVSGKPTRLSMVCGNVKENSITGMLKEFNIAENSVLILDRGYCGRGILNEVIGNNCDFVVAAKRNNAAYSTANENTKRFTWEGRAIDSWAGECWGYHAYRFEDAFLRADERYDKYKAEEEKGIEPKGLEKAGNVLLISSLDADPKDIYRLYKLRCAVENFFDTAKNGLHGDSTYMRTDTHIMGYNFVTFLAFCIWYDIRSKLEAAGLEHRYTPANVLRKFAAVKMYYLSNGPKISDVPKDVRELGAKIGIELG